MIYDLRSKIIPTFYPGCNNFFLYAAIQQALGRLDIPKEKIVMVFDIGCIGNMADFFNTYGVHSLHGRCIPTAVGVKLARPDLTVLAIGGDGGIYGEGLGHLIAASRANYNITTIVANNFLYSLTTGQTSPTTPKGAKTKSTPLGSPNVPIDPVALLHTVNSETLVSSINGQNLPEVTSAIIQSLRHPGFSLIDLRQTCITFGKQLL